ncbi:unnamed protein product [Adineta steineri]|uniref:Uncharacterized protein n=1 Tax=Adineta steineri TaxID=433720 RepID=A0A819NX99_9BILA|nr:unnamed protein product [Adineta steineri]CAF4003607.1 unnamed protein product [Adineta steineri]
MGLDGLGKTTIAYKFKLHEIIETISSISYNVETVYYKKKIRQYFPNTQAFIFIIDLYDNTRLEEATEELWSVLSENEVIKLSLLIYLNKIDLEYRLKQDGIIKIWLINTIKSPLY